MATTTREGRNEEEEKVSNQHDASPKFSYGSVESRQVRGKDVFLAKLDAWGGPLVLLFQTWFGLLPILGPLYYITYVNWFVGDFQLLCQRFDDLTPTRIACDITFVASGMFPAVTRVAAAGLATWSIVRQRIFYVLLERRILLDMDDTSRISRSVLSMVLAFLLLAFVHLFMYLKLATKLTEKELELELHEREINFASREQMLQTSMADLMSSPGQLVDKHNEYLLEWLVHAGSNYVIPAVLSVGFVFATADVEGYLDPLIKVYEKYPFYAHSHLSASTPMCEELVREIIQGHDEQSSDANSKPDVSQICETLRSEALALGKLPSLSSRSVELETGLVDEIEIESTSSLGIADLMSTKAWWPLDIILRDNPPGHEGIHFRKVWMVHCVLCAIILFFEGFLRMYGSWKMFNRLGTSKANCGLSTWMLHFCLCSWLAVICFGALPSLLRNILASLH